MLPGEGAAEASSMGPPPTTLGVRLLLQSPAMEGALLDSVHRKSQHRKGAAGGLVHGRTKQRTLTVHFLTYPPGTAASFPAEVGTDGNANHSASEYIWALAVP